MQFTRDQKIEICKILESGIPVGAVAEYMYGSNPEMKAKFKGTLNNWLNAWKKALETGCEPFPGRGRRVVEYALSVEQENALEKIAKILSK